MRTERCANEGKVCLMAFNTIHMCNSSDMVCLKEGETSCTVHDTMPCAVEKKLSIVVRPSYTVGNVFNNVSTQFPNYQAFDLVLQSPNQEESVLLNDKKEKPLYEIPGFRQNEKNTLVLMPVGSYKHNVKSKVDIDEKISPASEDEIALGESASPTEPDPAYPHLPNTKSETSRRCDERFSAEDSQQTKLFPTPKIPKRYVGLVNQAMTCYLNSLLQALFMTPEFRNALYNWVFDQEGEAKSIPYQLQKLFLNLQTSTKIAIETTDLTKSFGWRSNEAWHQHDIQELCRVMFEALENKFKNTGQADLINNLYQGKMMDYVKCLECCTEKSREDTFLDIPLPVRPFKSAVAYGSVEEALRAFVQPETLDGNNQYFCEKCNKKCDAHKGLKFTKFPYILTLHLKRFDFDYETLHRIKLNDMVTFPQTLNVSSFIKTEGNFQQNHNHVHVNGFANESENGEKAVKFDDCSTTDSGAALEEDNCSGTATIASSVQHDGELQDDDEGIDMSSSTDNRSNTSNESNQYMYDLFAIMIHSGSASGGHYYAYIKDFDTGEWYCFNDQSVTPITQDDIEKSYGGGTKAYYSGAYSSSTNAYMLMYRQIDVKQNASAIKTEQFPDHIKSLLQKLKDKDEEEKKPIISDLITRRVHFYNPALKTIKNSNIRLLWDSTFDHVLKRAHGILEVENFAPISRCRLVAYDHQSQEIERSLEGRENDLFGDVVSSLEPHLHFLLETRGENEEFDVYEPGGFTMKVFKININNGDIDGPYLVRAIETQSVQSFKKKIAKELRVNVEELIVVLETSGDGVVVLKDDAEKLYPRSKVYVACEKNYTDETGEKLKEFVNENFANMTFLYVSLPQIDKVTLKILDIPEYVPRTETKESSLATPKSSPVEESISTETKVSISSPKKGKGKKDSTSVSPKKEKTKSIKTPLSSPKKETTKNTVETTAKDLSASKDSSVPPSASPTKNTQMSTSGSGTGTLMTSSSIQQYAGAVGGGGESNSEDSSLSDGDRTLVETAPLELSRVSSLSHSPQLSSPDDDICGPKSPPYLADDIPTDEEDDENLTESERGLYFRAYLIQDYDCMTASFLNGKKSENDYSLKDTVPKERKLKVFLDKRMKISSLKRALEPHIQVSADYFKIVRKQTDLLTFDDAEEISIELGQVLKKGEYRVKVYYLKLNQPNNESISFPFICEKVLHDEIPIPVFKKDILDHIHKLDPKYHTITMENSRLWDKNGRSLSRILQDDDIINSNLMFSTTCEIVIQEHEDAVCPVGSEDSLTLFVRRYCPSTLELQPFQEITLEKNDELKETLSKLSGIPVDNIVYYKDTISFPVTNFDPNSIPWLTNAATLDDQPLLSSRSSSVYFYKDKTEETKKLTKEEKCDLVEKHRFEQILGFSSSYSPRREHSLKIYTDPSPVKTDKPSSADVDK